MEANFIIRARDRTRDAFASAENRMNRFSRTARLSLGGFGAGLSVAGLVRYGRAALNTADTIDNLASRLRLGHESVQTLGVLAREAGISVESFQSTLDRLQQQTDQARNGNEKAIQSFADLGITLQDLERKSPEQVLEAVTRAMVSNQGSARASVAATDLLGARSTRLQGILNQLGEKGFGELNAEMLATAQIMEESMVRAGDKMEEGLSRALNRMTTKVNTFAIKGLSGMKIFADGVGAELSDMSWMDRAQMFAGGNPVTVLSELFKRRDSLTENFKDSARDLFEPVEPPTPFEPEAIAAPIEEALDDAGTDLAEKIKDAFATFRTEDLINRVQENLLAKAQQTREKHTTLLTTINRTLQDQDNALVGA